MANETGRSEEALPAYNVLGFKCNWELAGTYHSSVEFSILIGWKGLVNLL